MPRTKSASKALRASARRRQSNLVYKRALKKLLKQARGQGKLDLAAASQLLDKAAKVRVIHRNTAARLKRKLAKRLAKKQ